MKSRPARLKGLTALWPLMRDPSIPAWAKVAIPAIAAAYVISPVDLIPDFLLGAGQIDDIGVILLAASASVAFLQRFFVPRDSEPAGSKTAEAQDAPHVYDATYRVK